MGSSLTALIAPAGTELEPEAGQRGLRVVHLPQAMLIVPLLGTYCAEWQVAEMQSTHLASSVIEWMTTTRARAAIAYVENETFAGEAMQGAAIWHSRGLAWGPHFTCNNAADEEDPYVYRRELTDSAINRALRELGVERGDEVDEYAALGLHFKRQTADWLA